MTTHTEASVLAEFTQTHSQTTDPFGVYTVTDVQRMAAALAEARNALENHDLMVVHSAEVLAELARVLPIVEAAREIVNWWDDGEGLYPGLDRLEDAVRAADTTTELKERTDAK